MLTWLLITILILTGWGGMLGWSFEHVEAHCLHANERLYLEQLEGPLRACR